MLKIIAVASGNLRVARTSSDVEGVGTGPPLRAESPEGASPFSWRNDEAAMGSFRERHVAMKPLERVLTVALRSQQTAKAWFLQAQLRGQPWSTPTWTCGSMWAAGGRGKQVVYPLTWQHLYLQESPLRLV